MSVRFIRGSVMRSGCRWEPAPLRRPALEAMHSFETTADSTSATPPNRPYYERTSSAPETEPATTPAADEHQAEHRSEERSPGNHHATRKLETRLRCHTSAASTTLAIMVAAASAIATVAAGTETLLGGTQRSCGRATAAGSDATHAILGTQLELAVGPQPAGGCATFNAAASRRQRVIAGPTRADSPSARCSAMSLPLLIQARRTSCPR